MCINALRVVFMFTDLLELQLRISHTGFLNFGGGSGLQVVLG